MMADNIGYPDYLVDDKLLDDEYKDVSIIKIWLTNEYELFS